MPREPMSPDWLITAGAAGVDIFFVISGFIMMVVAFPPGGPADRPWSFMRKRIARIYPLYWATALAVVLIWAMGVVTIVPNPGISAGEPRSLPPARADRRFAHSDFVDARARDELLSVVRDHAVLRQPSDLADRCRGAYCASDCPCAAGAGRRFRPVPGRARSRSSSPSGWRSATCIYGARLKPLHWAIPATAFALLLLAPLVLPA